MGILDRDYMLRGRRDRASDRAAGRVGVLSLLSVTTWIILINVAVFVVDPFLLRADIFYPEPMGNGVFLKAMPLTGLGYFSVWLAVFHLEVWRFVTCQFIHAGQMHLVMNMLSLYLFGPMIESYLGRKKFLAFYLLSGAGGPVVYVLLWAAHVLIPNPGVPLVGASAGIFGILIAAATIAPNETVLMYGIVPMRLRTLAWLLLAVAAYTVLAYGSSGQHNAGGEAAHLGGAAVGWLLIRNAHWLRVFDPAFYRKAPPF